MLKAQLNPRFLTQSKEKSLAAPAGGRDVRPPAEMDAPARAAPGSFDFGIWPDKLIRPAPFAEVPGGAMTFLRAGFAWVIGPHGSAAQIWSSPRP